MHQYAGAQTKPHTTVSAFILAAEQQLENALIEACVRDGRDSRLATDLRNLSREVYELRLREIRS